MLYSKNILMSGVWFVATAAAVSNCAAQSTPTPQRTLLALSKTDHTLALVDPASLKVIARLPVGTDPHEVIASTDGTRAYVTIYGGGSLHELDILDLVGQKALPVYDTKPLMGPHGVDYNGGKVWFTAEGSKSIGRYDPATGQTDWVMGTGQDRTHMIFVTSNGKRVYTTNVSSGTVSILVDTVMQMRMGPPPGAPGGAPGNPPGGAPGNPPGGAPGGGMPPPGPGPRAREDWSETVIPVSRGSEGFDVSPDGSELWTAASDDGSIAIIDVWGKRLVTKLDAHVQGANRLKFTPDGGQVFVTSLGSGDLAIFDAKTRKEVKRLKIGHGAAGILMDPIGGRAFVACSADSYLAIVDLKTLEVTGKLDVGGVPDGLAWAVRP
jgi:YVTN family beta-propeller protein